MKKIIVLILLLKSIIATAQIVPAEDTTEHFVITETGKPIGKIIEKMMNKDGGRLVSQDGTVELIIPPGALSKKTTISIQTMTNTFQNGNGPSYRLEPSGIQFQQPVKIVFHYNPEESKDSAQLLMGIAMQDDKGQWYGLNEFTLDTVAKTISGNIDHFSIWATFDQLKLKTLFGRYRLKVKKSEMVILWGVFADEKEMKIRGLSKIKTMKAPDYIIWYVEGVRFGNATVGTLKKGLRGEQEDDVRTNDYTAPDNIPDVNPVTISVELTWSIKTKDGIFYRKAEVTTKILIYDNAYEVTMISSSEQFLGRRGGKFTFLDTGSFVVSLDGKDTKIIERKNKNTDTEFGFTGGECTILTLKPGSGSIHMLDGELINVTPATDSQPAVIEIIFQRTPLVVPLLFYDCLPIRHEPRATGTTAAANAISLEWSRTFPIVVKFYAKEGEQIIETLGKEGSEIYYKCTVAKLPDD